MPDALAELATAARLAPDNPRLAYVHAVALHDAGELAQARQLLTTAAARFPAYAPLREALAAYEGE